MGGPLLGISTLQSWVDTVTANVGFTSMVTGLRTWTITGIALVLVSLAVHFIFLHFGLTEAGPLGSAWGLGGGGGHEEKPPRPQKRTPRGMRPAGPQTPRRFSRNNPSSLTTYDSAGREYQGSRRVYRERDTGAPLPTEGAFGSWLRSDRD